MNTNKNEEEKPCIDLGIAEELLTSGKGALKQLGVMIERQKKKGVDVTAMEEHWLRGKAAERVAKHALKTAIDKYEVKEKEV